MFTKKTAGLFLAIVLIVTVFWFASDTLAQLGSRLFLPVVQRSSTPNSPTSTSQPSLTSVVLTSTPQSTANTTPIANTPVPNVGHPRLWLTSHSVATYRAWANDNNSLWRDGLALLAERARYEMDTEKRVPDQDCGDIAYEAYPTEMYALLFAFLSNVGPDEAQRAADGQRARTLLMHVMNEAAKGPASSADTVCNETQQYPPFRHPDFFTSDRDRARYHGEAFALTVDWIYPLLSPTDKATIRQVFLRWSDDIVTRGYHHPEPVGLVNDPQLLQDLQQVRFAGNNYYAAHMRNLGLMAMALDPVDDPDGRLHAYLNQATGAYLYIQNHLLVTDARGGLLPEGLEYSPQTASYITQFAWAMRTAGAPNASSAFDRTFWQAFVLTYYHSLSPNTVLRDVYGEQLPAYQPAWYGDAQHYNLPDFVSVFGALLHLSDNPTEQNAIRWAMQHTPNGGAEHILERVRNPVDFRESLLYFMAFDPSLPPPTDPRPQYPIEHQVAGLGWLFSRTDWSAQASWLTFRSGWNSIDHQMADGLHFEWYANGEWLSKGRNGYADIAEGIASSEFYNTLAIENSRPLDLDDSDWRIDLWRRGSQWNLVNSGDPSALRISTGDFYTFAESDATNLYNTEREGATQVTHASRSLLWLKQSNLVLTYDRASTQSAGGFKRWWLQLANPATVSGNRAQSTTPNGQTLTVDVLLPSTFSLQAVNTTDQQVQNTAASDSQMSVRLMTEAQGDPQTVRFLHLLQVGNTPQTAQVFGDTANWDGVLVGDVAVLFPRGYAAASLPLTITLPASAATILVTGLPANSGYTIARNGNMLTINSGGTQQSDAGGVLVVR